MVFSTVAEPLQGVLSVASFRTTSCTAPMVFSATLRDWRDILIARQTSLAFSKVVGVYTHQTLSSRSLRGHHSPHLMALALARRDHAVPAAGLGQR